MVKSMVDLSQIAGISLSLTDDGQLLFGDVMSAMVESVRQIDSLNAVWMDSSVGGTQDIYRVYWDAYRATDGAVLQQHGVNHAYVVLFPGCYGNEYAKTQGHYHPPVLGTTLATPEVYKVLHGHGYFLLQSSSPPYNAVDDSVLVEATAGDVFYVAPNYGHLTVNWGTEPLVFEAFLAANLTPITEPYRARRGGTHYIRRGFTAPEVVANVHYVSLPALRRVTCRQLESWEARWGELLYPWVVHHPADFAFLADPGQFDPAWTL